MRYLFFIILMVFLYAYSYADENPQSTLVFGVPEAYIPFSAVDSAGTVYGFSISFSQMLCKKMRVHCVYKPMIFKNLFTELPKNKIDAAIGAIAITKTIQENFVFTLPYLPSRVSNVAKLILGKKPIKQITLATAKNNIFGIRTESAFAELLTTHYPNLRSKSFNTISDMLEALNTNEVQFIILDTPVAKYWVNTEARHQLYLVGKSIDLKVGIGIILNKDNPELLAKLNQAILAVTSSDEFRQLLQTFFPLAK